MKHLLTLKLKPLLLSSRHVALNVSLKSCKFYLLNLLTMLWSHTIRMLKLFGILSVSKQVINAQTVTG
jgi:hypothetical protein